MAENDSLTPLERMAREKARLLEQASILDRDMAELRRLSELAAKYNLIVTPALTKNNVLEVSTERPSKLPPSKIKTDESNSSTVSWLIDCYLTDPRSPYQKLRFMTQRFYDGLLRRIGEDLGQKELSELKAQDLARQHENWIEGGKRIPMAHSLIGMVRMLFSFGATVLENPDCERLSVMLSKFKFPLAKPRNEQMTAEQAAAIRAKAHELGRPSIALAQALQFDCGLRQKDVIGEWAPLTEHGVSDIVFNGQKWLRGIRWSEIDGDLVLRHEESNGGRHVTLKLTEYPMVAVELARIKRRPSNGAVVVNDRTGRPWVTGEFRRWWRQIADAAGVPKEVMNRDSRASAAKFSSASKKGA